MNQVHVSASSPLKRIHVIGRKNSGKTTLVVELVQACQQLGLRVGTIKHTHHQHELDTPGKDSHRHREAGAEVVGILTRNMSAVFWPPQETLEEPSDGDRSQRYADFAPMFEACDLVIVEGDSQTDQPKIEVWRAAVGTPAMALDDKTIKAVVTDDTLKVACQLWGRSDVSVLAKNILELLS